MKIFSKYAYMGAIALVGAVGFTACSSDDDLTAPQNPTFDGESVKTQFAISIPYAGKGTRLTEDIVQGQNTPTFRGIDNISLIPFKDTPAAGKTSEPIINLGAIQPDELGEGTRAKVYYDVELAEGVNNFLFYGEAIEATGAKKANGALNATIATAVDNIKFELVPISSPATSEETTKLLAALNAVAGTVDGTGKKWSASTSDLQQYYQSFIRLKAGSAASIKLALNNLEIGITSAAANGEDDLKNAILASITGAIGASGTIKDCTYPRNLGLPDGSAQIKWNNVSSAFEYITSANVGNLSYTDMKNFVYPASLYYWVNTPIKTSDKSLADQYATNWETCLKLYENDNAAVSASTASVALKNPINYAVARFDLLAKFNAEEVKDNLGGDVNTQANNGITLDGVLIGGQKNVKWDFSTPAPDAGGSGSTSTEYTIYDASVTSTKVATATSDIMAYSLALETAQGTEVRFALELTNQTGNAFTGKDGIVPNEGRFYLVGKLTPDATQVESDNRVFRQDHTTKATVTINSLENAYNCIPDLRSPKLELGLSVDLEWKQGLVDEVTIE